MTEPALVVLVIDDEIQIRRFLRAGLELDGFVEADTDAHTYLHNLLFYTPVC